MKLRMVEYSPGNPDSIGREEKTFHGETAEQAIDAWAMWNGNEAFDFRLPIRGTVEILTAHMRKDGDVLIMGGENRYAADGTEFAFRFDLTSK